MSSFFTDAQKTSLENIMTILHDTFMRPIVIWKQKDEIVLSEATSHDFIYNNAPINTSTTTIPVSGIFNARILYGQHQSLDFFEAIKSRNGGDQLNVLIDNGTVRLKLDATGAAFIEDAQRVTLDGSVFVIEEGKRPHGLFSPQYYTYTLKRQN